MSPSPCCLLAIFHQMLATPSVHWQESCDSLLFSSSRRSFLGLIPHALMNTNPLFTVSALLWMRFQCPTSDFHADNKETNQASLKYSKQKSPYMIGLEWSAKEVTLQNIQMILTSSGFISWHILPWYGRTILFFSNHIVNTALNSHHKE